MTQLRFKIVVIPTSTTEPDLEELKNYVINCGLVVKAAQKVELTEEYCAHPQILEWAVDVHAINQEIISNTRKVSLYQDLCKKWKVSTFMCPPGERPILQFSDNECFLRKRKPCHKSTLKSLSFGVHAKAGEYLLYAEIARRNSVHFYHDCGEICVRFHVDDLNKKEFFIQCKHVRNIFADISESAFDLYLDLLCPPLIYDRYECPDSGRVTITRELPLWIDKSVAGKANVIRFRFNNWRNPYELLSCLRYKCGKCPVNFIHMTEKLKSPPNIPVLDSSHFGCSYLWTALMFRTFILIEQTQDLNQAMRKLSLYSLTRPFSLEKTLTAVLFAVDSGKLVNFWHTIDRLFTFYSDLENSENYSDYVVPKKCRLIRRVTLTPMRMLLWPADLMCENRVLRNFDAEFVLRVTFRDDDMITLNVRKNMQTIYNEAIIKHMNSGILIGGRKYEMLAWSSSQLKEHGVTMYAKDREGRTAETIRAWTEMFPLTPMNIPKCLARIGQCFSQTEDTLHIPLDGVQIRFESDIENGNNPVTIRPYCFSDGIGKISVGLSKQVGEKIRHGKECSAFQIRYGGCKGMLVVDPTLKDADIVFRESMRKFNCRGTSHTKLEIAKKSGPITLRLNRPLIAILHDLGVHPAIFLRLQENMLKNLTDMLLDEKEAATYLNARTPFSTLKFKDLSLSGIGLTSEPFFRTLLLALHRYYIDIIKTKANIEIDPSEGRNMFGVLDETGKLQYGQVFVQYSEDISFGKTTPDKTKILRGVVMVTKCPCVHPGDVRKFIAVDIPELHHIIDCIVFPQNGPRPHPDEMSGSDLDGDEYAVMWNKDLFFPGPNRDAADYPKPRTKKYSNVASFLLSSDTKDVVDFLVDYIKKDKIGSIAIAHLAYADYLSVDDLLCLEIAAKHAIAVDFAKTGCSSFLNPYEMPFFYPDFLEKFNKPRYRSKKSLGKLYRVSKDFENENQASVLRYQDVKVDTALVVNGWMEFEQSAIASKHKYNRMLKTILQTYGILHETEAFGGAFIKLHSRFRERRDRAEIVSVVHAWLQELLDKTRKEFFSGICIDDNVDAMTRRTAQKASAWYVVTYRDPNPEFLSFPWVVSEVLSNIRIINPDQINRPVFYEPLIDKLEKLIYENERSNMLPPLPSEAAAFLSNLAYNCDLIIIERTIRVLIKWANEERIISLTSRPQRKFLYLKTFLKLIVYVAEMEGYAYNPADGLRNLQGIPSSAALCISFFRLCVKLRFCSKQQVREILPFDVYNDRLLSKRAMVMFHSIAVTGKFRTLCNQEYMDPEDEFIEMKPVSIENSIFSPNPIVESRLYQASNILQKHSEVEEVYMRENLQTKKVIVSAYGSIYCLHRLENLLRKDEGFLRSLFATGEIPELPANLAH